MKLGGKDIGRLRWAIRHSKLGTERVLQQVQYYAPNDMVEWVNVPEIVFPSEDFEPKS